LSASFIPIGRRLQRWRRGRYCESTPVTPRRLSPSTKARHNLRQGAQDQQPRYRQRASAAVLQRQHIDGTSSRGAQHSYKPALFFFSGSTCGQTLGLARHTREQTLGLARHTREQTSQGWLGARTCQQCDSINNKPALASQRQHARADTRAGSAHALLSAYFRQ
jgi:hypothetical protein